MIEIKKEEQDKIVSYFRELIEKEKLETKEFRETVIPESWERYLGVYSSKKNKDFPWEDAANFHIPFASWTCTALESRFVNGVFSGRKIAAINDLSGNKEESARKIENSFNFYFVPKMDLYNKICNLFQGLVVEGTRFIKIYPLFYKKTVYKYNLIRKIIDGVQKFLGYEVEEGKLATKKIEKEIFIPYWEDISVVDCFWERGAKNIQDASWFAQRLYRNKQDIMRSDWLNKEAYENIEIEKQRNLESDEVKDEHLGISETFNYENYEIYEIWCKYQMEDDEEEKDYQFVIDIKNNVLLYADENKFFDKRKPYVAIPCYRIADRITGQSIPQRIALLNDELDTIHNITIDNATLANAITFMYIPNRGFDPSRIKIKPGAAIPVPDFNVIQQFPIRNVSVDLYKLESFVVSMLEKITAVPETAFGKEQVERPTARGTLALLQEFAVNVNFLLKNIQQGIKEAVRQTLQVLYEFMPQEGIQYSENNILKREDLEDLEDYEINVLADAVRAMKDIDKQTALTLLNIFAGDKSGEVDIYQLKRNLIDALDSRLTDKVMRTPEEIRQMEEAKQQIVQTAQALKQKEEELLMREGLIKENELRQELKEAGFDDKEIERRAKEFRRNYVKSIVKGRNNEQLQ